MNCEKSLIKRPTILNKIHSIVKFYDTNLITVCDLQKTVNRINTVHRRAEQYPKEIQKEKNRHCKRKQRESFL